MRLWPIISVQLFRVYASIDKQSNLLRRKSTGADQIAWFQRAYVYDSRFQWPPTHSNEGGRAPLTVRNKAYPVPAKPSMNPGG